MGGTTLTQKQWVNRYFELAELVATWSKDRSTKVGAVIVDQHKRIVSVGFNGPPMGVVDDPDVSRKEKLLRTLHAEENAILFANGSKSNLDQCTMYITQPPCAHCAAVIIQSGIKKVHYDTAGDLFYERWADSLELSATMFKEANINVEQTERPVPAKQQMLDVLKELQECSHYWSEYFVPIGIHGRIARAIKAGEAEYEQTESQAKTL